MTKKVGRNDPCPCGSGKKYKHCCELRLGAKRKFSASVISSGQGAAGSLKGKATQISTNFFSNVSEKVAGIPRKPTDNEPHHPPQGDKPM